jgi:hypothetical protein
MRGLGCRRSTPRRARVPARKRWERGNEGGWRRSRVREDSLPSLRVRGGRSRDTRCRQHGKPPFPRLPSFVFSPDFGGRLILFLSLSSGILLGGQRRFSASDPSQDRAIPEKGRARAGIASPGLEPGREKGGGPPEKREREGRARTCKAIVEGGRWSSSRSETSSLRSTPSTLSTSFLLLPRCSTLLLSRLLLKTTTDGDSPVAESRRRRRRRSEIGEIEAGSYDDVDVREKRW